MVINAYFKTFLFLAHLESNHVRVLQTTPILEVKAIYLFIYSRKNAINNKITANI